MACYFQKLSYCNSEQQLYNKLSPKPYKPLTQILNFLGFLKQGTSANCGHTAKHPSYSIRSDHTKWLQGEVTPHGDLNQLVKLQPKTATAKLRLQQKWLLNLSPKPEASCSPQTCGFQKQGAHNIDAEMLTSLLRGPPEPPQGANPVRCIPERTQQLQQQLHQQFTAHVQQELLAT